MEGLEKERDFYFGKLRDIEVQCQEEEDAPAGSVIEKIRAILYATEVSTGGLRFTTLFVDTQLWKTKHSQKHSQNSRHSCLLLTDRIEIHQSQPDSMM